jgi:hypothetical protein
MYSKPATGYHPDNGALADQAGGSLMCGWVEIQQYTSQYARRHIKVQTCISTYRLADPMCNKHQHCFYMPRGGLTCFTMDRADSHTEDSAYVSNNDLPAYTAVALLSSIRATTISSSNVEASISTRPVGSMIPLCP